MRWRKLGRRRKFGWSLVFKIDFERPHDQVNRVLDLLEFGESGCLNLYAYIKPGGWGGNAQSLWSP